MAGATGDFRDQYSQATEALITLLQDNKSIRTGEVIWAGVVAQDPDSATVILATTGTVQNNQTGANPKAENYRIQMQLVAEKGRWLTSDLQFVRMTRQNPRRPASSRAPVSRPRRVAGQGSTPTEPPVVEESRRPRWFEELRSNRLETPETTRVSASPELTWFRDGRRAPSSTA